MHEMPKKLRKFFEKISLFFSVAKNEEKGKLYRGKGRV